MVIEEKEGPGLARDGRRTRRGLVLDPRGADIDEVENVIQRLGKVKNILVNSRSGLPPQQFIEQRVNSPSEVASSLESSFLIPLSACAMLEQILTSLDISRL